MRTLLKRLLGLNLPRDRGAASENGAARPAAAAVAAGVPVAHPPSTAVVPVNHSATLEALLRACPGGEPHEIFRHVSDDFWFWAHTEGYRSSPALRELLPGMPSTELQLEFTGCSGDDTLGEAAWAYLAFKGLFEFFRGPLGRCENVLDFGCGWGRMTRFFLRDIEPARLWGVDPDAEAIAACAQTNRWCRFQQIPCHPPYPLPGGAFDAVFSYSVFSHLSEARHHEVLRELHRLLRPGGLLVASTYPRTIFSFFRFLREEAEELATIWPTSVMTSAASFPDTEQALADYDAGRYCYWPYPVDDEWSYWGDTAIPEAYARDHWGQLFEFLTFVSDPDTCPQSVIVVRR